MKISLQKISKTYENINALAPVDLEFRPGVYGLLGPNGAGKTTLMNIIAANIKPTAGTVLYNGEDIVSLGEDYRRHLGYMPQQQNLYPTFTASRFLSYIASLKGMDAARAKTEIPTLIDRVGLAARGNDRLGTFSGGMKQRILFASALLNDPSILILDEPSAGLDPRERIRMKNLISEMASERIVILASHIVSDIEHLASVVLLLEKGVLLDQAPPRELFESHVGHVFEADVSTTVYESLRNELKISRATYDNDGVRIRFIGEPPRDLEVTPAYPNLEDVYLARFSENAALPVS